jgi:metal-sulfur cluster biosynthetic enzyme
MLEMKEQIIKELKTVYDPEMPSINIMDLGLVYDIDIKDKDVTITHTLTSIFCPMADEISKNIKEAVERVKDVEVVKVKLTHTPPFTKEMMSEEARLTLNL